MSRKNARQGYIKPIVMKQINVPKELQEKRALINRLIFSVIDIYPAKMTTSNFRKIPFTTHENSGENTKTLFWILLHTVTLINQSHRKQDQRGYYISNKEDYDNATKLMKTLEGFVIWK